MREIIKYGLELASSSGVSDEEFKRYERRIKNQEMVRAILRIDGDRTFAVSLEELPYIGRYDAMNAEIVCWKR